LDKISIELIKADDSANRMPLLFSDGD